MQSYIPLHSIALHHFPIHSNTDAFIWWHSRIHYMALNAIIHSTWLTSILLHAIRCTCTFRVIPWHSITLPYITLHSIYIPLHYIPVRSTTIHCIPKDRIILHYTPLNFTTCHYILQTWLFFLFSSTWHLREPWMVMMVMMSDPKDSIKWQELVASSSWYSPAATFEGTLRVCLVGVYSHPTMIYLWYLHHLSWSVLL